MNASIISQIRESFERENKNFLLNFTKKIKENISLEKNNLLKNSGNNLDLKNLFKHLKDDESILKLIYDENINNQQSLTEIVGEIKEEEINSMTLFDKKVISDIKKFRYTNEPKHKDLNSFFPKIKTLEYTCVELFKKKEKYFIEKLNRLEIYFLRPVTPLTVILFMNKYKISNKAVSFHGFINPNLITLSYDNEELFQCLTEQIDTILNSKFNLKINNDIVMPYSLINEFWASMQDVKDSKKMANIFNEQKRFSNIKNYEEVCNNLLHMIEHNDEDGVEFSF